MNRIQASKQRKQVNWNARNNNQSMNVPMVHFS